jgi:hypothetical protein
VVWCEPEHDEGTRLNRTANYRAAPVSAVTAEDERARHDGGVRVVARCTGFYVSVGIAGFIRPILVMGLAMPDPGRRCRSPGSAHGPSKSGLVIEPNSLHAFPGALVNCERVLDFSDHAGLSSLTRLRSACFNFARSLLVDDCAFFRK